MIQMRAKAQADAIKTISESLNSDIAKEAATLALAKEVSELNILGEILFGM